MLLSNDAQNNHGLAQTPYGYGSSLLAILRKEHAKVSSDNASYIFDDTTLEKTGYGIEQISRVFDHVQGKCILGFKLLVCAFLTERVRYL